MITVICQNEREYILMNKDLPLTSFHLRDIGEWHFELSDIRALSGSPYAEEHCLESLLYRRAPDKNREYLEKLLKYVKINGISEYLYITHGLSLNDTLWFKPADAPQDVNWQTVNLYDNEFDEIIAHFTLCGQGLAGSYTKPISPEFGTNGMLPKCWAPRN